MKVILSLFLAGAALAQTNSYIGYNLCYTNNVAEIYTPIVPPVHTGAWTYIARPPDIIRSIEQVVKVEKKCSLCPTGTLADTGYRVFNLYKEKEAGRIWITNRSLFPPIFPHNCSSCTNSVWLDKSYPSYETNVVVLP